MTAPIEMSITEERILAIDYGKKRVGLALSDPLKLFAYPLETLMNDAKFMQQLLSIIVKYNVNEIILGYPLKENGEKSESTLMVESFHEELTKKTQIPIRLFDERYSSEMAMNNILQSVTSKKKRRDKGLVDRNAAAVILSEYLREIQK